MAATPIIKHQKSPRAAKRLRGEKMLGFNFMCGKNADSNCGDVFSEGGHRDLDKNLRHHPNP